MDILKYMLCGPFTGRYNGATDIQYECPIPGNAVRIDIQAARESCREYCKDHIDVPEDKDIFVGLNLVAPFPHMCLEWKHRVISKNGNPGFIPVAAYVRDEPGQARFRCELFLGFRDFVENVPAVIDYDTARRINQSRIATWFTYPSQSYPSDICDLAGGMTAVIGWFLYQSQWRTLTRFEREGNILKFRNGPLALVRKAGYLTRFHFMTFKPKDKHGRHGAAFGCRACNSGRGHAESVTFGGLAHLGVFEVPASGAYLDALLGHKIRLLFKNSEPRNEDVELCQVREMQRLHRWQIEALKTVCSQVKSNNSVLTVQEFGKPN